MPFHCEDIHMPNHSPPIAMKPTSHSSTPRPRPAVASPLARRNSACGARRRDYMRQAPAHSSTAVASWVAMISA